MKSLVLVFWLAGAAFFFGPFLGAPDGLSTDVDLGRSEDDIPFAEDVVLAEEDLEMELAGFIEQASLDWFAFDSPLLSEAGVVELDRLEPGREAYELHCVGCHGVQGDGAGPASRHLGPRPRNFLSGKFKFTSTATGKKPRREDLLRVLTAGLAGASMPDFRLLDRERRLDLVEYVRWLSMRGEFEQLLLDITYDEEELADPAEWAAEVYERWDEGALQRQYPGVPETPADDASVARGRALFLDVGTNCASCHGEGGKGDGPSAVMKDDWGYDLRPRDLTTGVYRVGDDPAALYLSIATGINGTPMPAFEGALEPEQIWDLVHFIQSLAERTP